MTPTLVLNVAGLSQEPLGKHTPHPSPAAANSIVKPIAAVTPAVTRSAQAAYLTGTLPNENGVVANGWHFRDLAEVSLWRQSNHLVQGHACGTLPEPVIPSLQSPIFSGGTTCTRPSTIRSPLDRCIRRTAGRSPRPHATARAASGAHQEARTFPVVSLLGSGWQTSESSRWITSASLHVMRVQNPTLALVYLPHLDYNLLTWLFSLRQHGTYVLWLWDFARWAKSYNHKKERSTPASNYSFSLRQQGSYVFLLTYFALQANMANKERFLPLCRRLKQLIDSARQARRSRVASDWMSA